MWARLTLLGKYKVDVPAAGRFINHSIPKKQRLTNLNLNEPEGGESSAAGAAAAGRERAIREQDEARVGKMGRMRFVASEGDVERVQVGGDGVEDLSDGDDLDQAEEVQEDEEQPGESAHTRFGENAGEQEVGGNEADHLLAEVSAGLPISKRKRAEEY